MENNKDINIRDILSKIGGEKRSTTQPIIEMLTEFEGEFKMFPLKFGGFSPITPTTPARAIIDIPNNIALSDPKPLMEDWVFMTLAFPKEPYRKYLEQKWGKPERSPI